MEYLHGQSLGVVSRQAWARGTIPSLLASRVIADAARGLHAAHELKLPDGRPAEVVHRDVSPQNIFVLYDGLSKIVDFGIAKSNERLAEHTATDVLKGKIAYLAPEQLRREPIDRRVDVFALGIVLWEISLGRRLFRADNEAATILMIVKGDVPKPSEIQPDYPLELERIVMRALESNRDNRYSTAADMAHDLDRFIAEKGVPYGAAEVSDFMHGLFASEMRDREELLASSRHTASANSIGQAAAPTTGSLSFKPAGPAALEPTVVATRPPSASGKSNAVNTASTSLSTVGDAAPRPARTSKWLRWLGAGLGLGVLASGTWLTGRALTASAQVVGHPVTARRTIVDAMTAADPSTDASTTGLARTSQAIHIATDPPTATLMIDGAPVANPFDSALRTGAPGHRLEARAPGYEPAIQDLEAPWPPSVILRLQRATTLGNHPAGGQRHGSEAPGTGPRAPHAIRRF